MYEILLLVRRMQHPDPEDGVVRCCQRIAPSVGIVVQAEEHAREEAGIYATMNWALGKQHWPPPDTQR